MYRTIWSITSLVFVLALALLGRVEAQQPQPHRGDAQVAQAQAPPATQDAPAQAPMMQQMQGMMQQMQGMMQQRRGGMGRGMMGRGMMGRGVMRAAEDDDESSRGAMKGHGMMGHGMMMQRKLGRLTQQLELSDDQQAKVQALLRAQAKETIRLKADIDTATIDLHQLLDAEPGDRASVKTALQSIASKEADLRLAHITTVQDIRTLLTPAQQKQFRTMWRPMMGRGGKMAHRGRMGRGGRQVQGRMTNPCSAQGKGSKN